MSTEPSQEMLHYAPPIDHDYRPSIVRKRLGWDQCWLNLTTGMWTGISSQPSEVLSVVDQLINGQLTVIKRLKEDRYCHVDLLEAAGHRWVVKTQHSRPWKTWLYHGFYMTPAWREWRGAQRAARCRARVNVPLALIHHGHFGHWRQTLVIPYVEGELLSEWMECAPPEDQWSAQTRAFRLSLAARMAQQVAKLVQGGWVNRDYKANNLVMDNRCMAGHDEPVLIDLAGIKPRYYRYKVIKMLRTLDISNRLFGAVRPIEELTFLHHLIKALPTLTPAGAGRLKRLIGELRSSDQSAE